MALATICILFLLLITSYMYTRSIVHPGVVTFGIWFILIIIYNVADFDLYELSDDFYKAVLLWAIPFGLTSSINQRTSSIIFPSISKEANLTTLSVLKPILVIALIFASFALIYRGMLYSSGNILYGIRQASLATLRGDEDAIPFPQWLKPFIEVANTAALPTCLYLLIIKRDFSKYSKLLLTLLIIFYLLRSNKNVIAQVGLAFVCLMMMGKNVNKTRLIIILAIFSILMVGISYLRRINTDTDTFEMSAFIASYLLAPLPAFDSVLNSASLIEDFHGEYTFRAFIKIMQIFDPSIVGNSDPFNLDNWVATPVPVNVYTALFPFYEDFGYMGIACFALILGYFAGVIFKHAMQGIVVSKLIYACMFYTLVFQFFADNFFQFLWTNITYMLFCIILVYRRLG